MTNQLTPQQLLEIARVVEPDKDWRITNNGIRVFLFNHKSDGNPVFGRTFEPTENTERGQAQLMNIVFAIVKKRGALILVDDEHPNAELFKNKLKTAFPHALSANNDKDNRVAILSLAHEVLCNAN